MGLAKLKSLKTDFWIETRSSGATMGIEVSPRGIWTGLTVPGKKMVALITEIGGSYRGQLLIDLYKERVKTLKELAHQLLVLHNGPRDFDDKAMKKWIKPETKEHLDRQRAVLEPC